MKFKILPSELKAVSEVRKNVKKLFKKSPATIRYEPDFGLTWQNKSDYVKIELPKKADDK